METRIEGKETKIDSNSVKELYSERALSRSGIDVDAPVVLTSDTDLKHIREWNEVEVNMWLPHINLNSDSRVLEVGFGTGRISKYIVEHAGKYIGIDYVDAFVETAEKRPDIKSSNGSRPVFRKGTFQQLVDGSLKLPIETFDRFVILGGVFMYTNDDELYRDIP